MAEQEVWHLSTGYTPERWGVYCHKPHRKGVDFRTFSTEQVTCPDCREVARANWKPTYFEKQQWGVSA